MSDILAGLNQPSTKRHLLLMERSWSWLRDGKNRVLTRRISYLIERVSPRNIWRRHLNKAASEMKDVDTWWVTRLGMYGSRHFLGRLRMLRRDISLLGYSSAFKS